jgi:hypothetical protein
VASRNWKRDLIADSFDATNDRKQLNIERATFDLPPGEYEIALEITDRDTGKNLRDRRPLKLSQPHDSQLRLSSIVFTQPIPASRLSAASPQSGAEVLAAWKTSSRSALRDSLPVNFTAILMNVTLGKNPPLDGISEKKAATIGPGAYFEIMAPPPAKSCNCNTKFAIGASTSYKHGKKRLRSRKRRFAIWRFWKGRLTSRDCTRFVSRPNR